MDYLSLNNHATLYPFTSVTAISIKNGKKIGSLFLLHKVEINCCQIAKPTKKTSV